MLVSIAFIIPLFKKKNKKIITYLFPAPSSTEYAACKFCFFYANIWGDNEKVTLAKH